MAQRLKRAKDGSARCRMTPPARDRLGYDTLDLRFRQGPFSEAFDNQRSALVTSYIPEGLS